MGRRWRAPRGSRDAGEVAAGEVEAGDGVGDDEGAAEPVGHHDAQLVVGACVCSRPDAQQAVLHVALALAEEVRIIAELVAVLE
jgi:hypothetical protein